MPRALVWLLWLAGCAESSRQVQQSVSMAPLDARAQAEWALALLERGQAARVMTGCEGERCSTMVLAIAQAHAGRLEAAVALLRRAAVASSPSTERAYQRDVVILHDRGEDVLPLLRDLAPLFATVRYWRGVDALGADHLRLAIDELRGCVALRDELGVAPLCFRALGIAYARAGIDEMAERAHRAYAELAPAAPDIEALGEVIRAHQERRRPQALPRLTEEHERQTTSCFLDGLEDGELGHGDYELVLHFTRHPDGAVSEAWLSEVRGPVQVARPRRFEACIENAVMGWRFSPRAGRTAERVREVVLGPVSFL